VSAASEPATAPAVLELDRLTVRYGGVTAVRELSVEVRGGEIVGLIGPNGAGKSTTLHAIMGAVPVEDGDVRLSGRSVRGRAPEAIARSGVALVPEGRRIFAELTVEENLRLGLSGRRSREGAEEAVEEVYDLFPVVREFGRRQAGALSGGQQQQLAIGRALVMGRACCCSTSRPKASSLRSSRTSAAPSPTCAGSARWPSFLWNSTSTLRVSWATILP